MRIGGGGSPKPTQPKGIAARTNYKPPAPQTRQQQVQFHVDHYSDNPRQHAKALKALGVPKPGIQLLHKEHVQSMGVQMHPSGALNYAVGLGAKTIHELADAAVYSPAGMYQVGKAGYQDILSPHNALHPSNLSHLRRIGKAMVKGVEQDVQHPLRHPGYALLDASALVGGTEGLVSRVAARSLRRPLTRAVERTEGDLTVRTPASKRAGIAALQRKFARQGPGPVGKALTQERSVTEAVDRAPMEALSHRSRQLTTPQQTALRVVNEGKAIQERVRFHERMRGEASKLGPATAFHRQKILLLQAAQRYVTHDEHGAPALKPVEQATSKREATMLRRLHDTQENLGQVAKTREQRLSLLGELGDGRIESRLHGPGQVIETGHVHREPVPPTPGQTSLLTPGAKFEGGKVRIPYTAETPPRALGAHSGFRGGIPRRPASVTHSFEGGLLKAGNFRDNTAQLVAESGLEAQRYTALHRLRDRVIAAAHQAPQEGDIAVRLDSMKGKPFPAEIKAAMRKREDGIKLSRQEQQTLTDAHNTARDELFPKIDPADHAQHPGVVWVNPKVLNGLDKAPFRLPHNRTVGAIDAVNNAQKMAILYLKPAYAVPNIAGNVFMNVAQQGPRALEAWWKSTSHAMEKRYGTDATAVVDSVMGEGVARSLDTHQGIGAKVVGGAAGGWSKVVDRVFRRAALRHEANRLGYKTDAQYRSLLLDEKHRPDLVEAAQRAKEAIIDYERLGPAEREIVRRAIFFYPWVKGSTRYAKHFLVEHPIQSAALGNLGQYGKQHTDLGPTPSYLEGSFGVGHNKLVNPAAASVTQTPAQVVQTLEAMAHGGMNAASTPGAFATPAVDLIRALGFRQDSFGNAISPKTGALDIAKKTLVDSTPQATLYQRITAKNKGRKLFPLSPKEALTQFTLGGIAPKTYNPTVLHAQAKAEQRSLMAPHERVLGDYKTFTSDLRQAMKKVGEPRLPQEVAARLNLRQERATNRVKVAAGHKLDSKDAFGADIDLIVQHGWMNKTEADQAKAWAAKAGKHDLRTAAAYLTRHYFDRDGLLSKSLKYLREHGSPNLSYPTLP